MDFGFSVTATMDAFGAGMIPKGDAVALDVAAVFFALGWLAFLTVFPFGDDVFTAGFVAFFATGLVAFFTAGFVTFFAVGFFVVGLVTFLVADFFFVSSFFFFVVAILTSYKFQVSGFKYQVIHLEDINGYKRKPRK